MLYTWRLAQKATRFVQYNRQHHSSVKQFSPGYRCDSNFFQTTHSSSQHHWLFAALNITYITPGLLFIPQTQELMSVRWVSLLFLMTIVWRAGSRLNTCLKWEMLLFKVQIYYSKFEEQYVIHVAEISNQIIWKEMIVIIFSTKEPHIRFS